MTKEKTQRRPSGLGRILGMMGFMAAANAVNIKGGNGFAYGGIKSASHGHPMYSPPRKKYKGIDKENNRKHSYNKFKKYQ